MLKLMYVKIKSPVTFFNGKRLTHAKGCNPSVKSVWRNVPFLKEITATAPLHLFDHTINFRQQDSLCFESK